MRNFKHAVVTFIDSHDADSRFSVYVNDYGFPHNRFGDGVLDMLREARRRTCELFEADDFAAAFISVVRTGEDSARLSRGWRHHCGLSFDYEVEAVDDRELIVRMYRHDTSGRRLIWSGPLGVDAVHGTDRVGAGFNRAA